MDAALRILDANLNRAREGLRMAEEYARLATGNEAGLAVLQRARELLKEFVLSDPSLAARLLDARDVEGDAGVDHGATAARGSLEDAARAGFKRAQEALRVVEEVAQVVAPSCAKFAASARYCTYTAETQVFQLGGRLRSLRSSPVMVVFTRAQCRGDWRATLAALHDAGARLFELREKDVHTGEFCAYAAQFVEAARGCTIIVNDRADVAAAVSADGVHVGQSDLPPQAARKVIGRGRLVGVSTHNLVEAQAAVASGADYLGLGAMFPTASKNVQSYASPQTVREVLGGVNVPVFCIGGVTPEKVGALRELGVKHVAAGASILGAKDPVAAFKALAQGLAG